MGEDKASLSYGGKPQVDRALGLLRLFCARVFLAGRADQEAAWRSRAEADGFLADTPGLRGPVAGIHAAQAAHPEAAFLVLACDLPLLGAADLAYLLSHRRPDQAATAYWSRPSDESLNPNGPSGESPDAFPGANRPSGESPDVFPSANRPSGESPGATGPGWPEPLCALYEPGFFPPFASEAPSPLGEPSPSWPSCPSKMLRSLSVEWVKPLSPLSLLNANRPANRERAEAALKTPLRLRVLYFASLRQAAGRSTEEIETFIDSPLHLYETLKVRYRFGFGPQNLSLAVNCEERPWDTRLASGDEVAFLPPVSGG